MIRPTALAIPFCLTFLSLAACKPPPTDEAGARGELVEQRKAPSPPIDSPDSSNAIWAASKVSGRLLYGNPGEAPMLAVTCNADDDAPTLTITRYVLADEGASALMALIGNGHIARLPVEATPRNDYFLWEGTFPADDPDLEVLTGQREVTMTIPGAGMVTMNPDEKPILLIESCRAPLLEKDIEEEGDFALDPDVDADEADSVLN